MHEVALVVQLGTTADVQREQTVVPAVDKLVGVVLPVPPLMELKLRNRKRHLFPRLAVNNLVLMELQVEQIGFQVAVAVLVVTVPTLQEQVVLVVQIQF